MGYTSFMTGESEGKNFYLFFEDAVKEGYYYINGYYNLYLHAGTFSILEYDLPDDLILKNMNVKKGNGLNFNYLNCSINKNDLDGKEIKISNVCELKKNTILLDEFKKSLNSIITFGENAKNDKEYYEEYFDKSIKSIINDNEQLIPVLSESRLFDSFRKTDGYLVETPFITKKSILFNRGYFYHCYLPNNEITGDYIGYQGFNFDNSTKQHDYKQKIIDNMDKKDKVRKLLIERNYMQE